MTNCKQGDKTCPFFMFWYGVKCSLGYTIKIIPSDQNLKFPFSQDCQLDIVQYSLKDKANSITFEPERE